MSDIEEILEGKVGYTTDGFVFLITDARDPDGQKIQATFTWDPPRAMKMAQDLANAATEASKCYNLSKVKKKGKKK